MKAIRFDGDSVRLEQVDLQESEGDARVRVLAVGVCNTDLEIVKGYAGFRGTLGHEFVGCVESAPPGFDHLVAERVVGEINCGCRECDDCLRGDPRHCRRRTVLGIVGRDGAMAEYVSLPAENLLRVPDEVSTEQAAFTEPLAAACEILEQVQIKPDDRIALVGDGKLGQLIGRVLLTTGASLTVFGRHPEKLDRLAGLGARTRIGTSDDTELGAYDIVVEASGSSDGFAFAQRLVRPRGTVVLKSTIHGDVPFDATSLIVNEVTLVGSRCGRFETALELLKTGAVRVDDLISRRMWLDDGEAVVAAASQRGVLKVLVQVN